ncbi:MAG: DUF6903 family protein [Breznakia sp.]
MMGVRIKTMVMIIVACICLAMIIIGQKNIGYKGLFIEIIGLIGLLTLLFMYNKDHK